MHPVEDPQTTFAYYNNASDYSRHDAAEFMEQVRQSPDHWAHPLVADMQAALHGRRVLEVAGCDECDERWMQKIYTKPGSPDIITLRERPDGTKYEIINNIFNERTLCDIFEPRALDLKITMGKLWWWASYTIR